MVMNGNLVVISVHHHHLRLHPPIRIEGIQGLFLQKICLEHEMIVVSKEKKQIVEMTLSSPLKVILDVRMVVSFLTFSLMLLGQDPDDLVGIWLFFLDRKDYFDREYRLRIDYLE